MSKGSNYRLTFEFELSSEMFFFLFLDSFKSAALILRDDLTVEQQQVLSRHVHEALKDFGVEDIMMLIPLLASSAPFQKIVLQKVAQFLAQELQMSIID